MLELYADRSRQLPALDPDGRSMVLSCGAALEPARLGFTAAGWRTEVDRLPDPGPLAALPARRTVRTPFTAATVPVGLQVAWRELAEAEGAELRWVAAP